MKLLILAAALSFGLNVMATDAAPVNEKVLKTFNEVFTHAQNVQWSSTESVNEARFKTGTITSRVLIDNDGKLLRTIRYYKQEELPASIRYKIKKGYEGKEIFGVTEVSNATDINYAVVIRDDKHIYNVVYDSNGDVVKSKKFKRGDI